MVVLQLIGFLIICATNFAALKFGFLNLRTGDKDILFPLSSMIFFFFSLLIYLPETHSKVSNLPHKQNDESLEHIAKDEEEGFPMAFLLALLAVTLATLIDKFLLHKIGEESKEEDERQLRNDTGALNGQIRPQDLKTIKYFLTLSVALLNVSNTYFITVESHKGHVLPELIIYLIFSLVLNFALGTGVVILGYLLAWAQVQEDLSHKLNIFVNCGIGVGFLLGLVLTAEFPVVILPCISVGLNIYSAIFICLPQIYTNGDNPVQDKFRYWAIIASMLLTVIYYPVVYLLKI